MLFITRFELFYSLKSTRTLLFGLIMFLITFLIVNILGGAFDSIKIMLVGENDKLNSPFMLSLLYSYLNMIGLIIVAVNAGKIALREYDFHATSFIFTTPLTKLSFLLSKFLAAFLISIFLFSCAVLGVMVATWMPYLDQAQFGPIGLNNYVLPFINIIVPNVFFTTAFFFGLASMFRNHFVNWLGVFALYALYYLSSHLGKNPNNIFLSALIDPFSLKSIGLASVGKSTDQLLNEAITRNSAIVWNRFMWTSIGICSLVLAYFKFSFQYSGISNKRAKKKSLPPAELKLHANAVQPEFHITNNKRASFQQLIFLTGFELKQLFKNLYFKIMLVIGLLVLVFSTSAIGQIYDTNTYPVAYNVSEVFMAAINLFLFIVIVVFSGEMVWRDRNLNTHFIGDALPVRSGIKYFSKICALVFLLIIVSFALVIIGIGTQYYMNYHNYEVDVFLKHFFGINFLSMLFLVGLSFAVQAFVNNRFTGYFILLGYYIFQSFFADALVENKAFILNSAPQMTYSDMNEFGYNTWVFILFKTYWFLFIALLLLVALQFLPHGTEIEFKTRLNKLKRQIKSKPIKQALYSVASGFALIGAYLFYNITVLNEFKSQASWEKELVEYEINYAEYKDKIEPIVTDVTIHAELYPENGSLHVDGSFWLKNKSNTSIQEICVNPSQADSLWLSVASKQKINTKTFLVYKLDQDLNPGDSIQLFFKIDNKPKGFTNFGVSSIVDRNGTFFTDGIMPKLGYDDGYELNANSRRRKYNLPEKSQSDRTMNDKNGLRRNVLGQEGLIRLSVTAGTSSNQTILAPGKLEKQWVSNDRNYFHYITEREINNFYAILSADYREEKDVWVSSDGTTHVELSIHHHPSHQYNLKNMMEGMKQTLTYCTDNYSPYQYSHLRIAEFPRFATYAQSFPGLIPFSEGIGFIADLRSVNMNDVSILNDTQEKIDYPFFVTAHEVAHQWWAHQVCAAQVEGSMFIIESITQYTALMVMKHYYGEEKMRKFLSREAFSYLSSRSKGAHAEKPLLTVNSDEQEVYYRKGAVMMYALQDYIGEEKVNQIIREFIKKYAYEPAPYPTSRELIDAFDAVSPDSLKYIINDWFRNITLYENKVTEANYSMNDDLEYTVDFTVDIKKYSYDVKGKEQIVSVNDYIPVAVFNSKGKMIYYDKIAVKTGQNKLELKLDRRPETIVIDPYNILLDKNWMLKKMTIKDQS